MENKTVFEISWLTLWRIAFFAFIIYILYFAREAVGVLSIAIVISLGLEPLVTFLEKRRIPRILGGLIIFLFIFLVVSTLLYLIVPIAIVEFGGFIEYFNRSFADVFGLGLPQSLISDLSLNLGKILGILDSANVSLTGAIGTIFSKTLLVLSTVIISFYLLVQKYGTERLLQVLLPDAYERTALKIFTSFKFKIQRWFVAQLGLSLIIGIVVSIGLWFLGVRYFLILGLLAAVLEVVPIIGPVVAGVVAFLVAVSTSFSLGLYTVLFFIIIQQLEGHILVPIILGKSMKMHPVVVLFALLAGGQIAGFVGVVLAVPFAVIAQEVFSHLAERKQRRAPLGI